jgi:hypothetical protein
MRSLLLAATLLAAVPAAAQPVIQLNQTVQGEVTDSDPRPGMNDYPYDEWRFQATAGASYHVLMVSKEGLRQPHLRVRWERCEDCWLEQFERGDTATYVRVDDAEGGTFIIQARSLYGRTGRYTLRLRDLEEAFREENQAAIDALDAAAAAAAPPEEPEEPAPPPPPDPALGTQCQYDLLYMGDTCAGELGPDESRDERGGDVDEWAFWGRQDQVVTVTVRSTDFDARLDAGILFPTGWQSAGTDDDGGGGTDSRLTFRISSEGLMMIRVSAADPGATGAYRVSVQLAPPGTDVPAAEPPNPASGLRLLVASRRADGFLEVGDRQGPGGEYHDDWAYRGTAGEVLTAQVGSQAFDTRLVVGRWVGTRWEELARDDDGGEGTDSRVRLTLPDEGLYVLRVSGSRPGETGQYTFWLTSGEDGGGRR